MAMQSVPKQSFYLPIDDVNRGGNLVRQVDSFIGLMASAVTSEDEPSTGEIATACYAIRDLLGEVQSIIERQREVAS